MGAGRFFFVIGPSGVGKDTLIDAAVAARPDLVRVRRVVTRAAGAGGEVIESVSEPEFARRDAAGEFLLAWRAHGLDYAIPARVLASLADGQDVIANGSRRVIGAARARVARAVILSVTARPETLAARLAQRGREDEAGIAARLAREATPPEGPDVIEIDNDGPLERAVAAMVRAVQPASG